LFSTPTLEGAPWQSRQNRESSGRGQRKREREREREREKERKKAREGHSEDASV